MQEDNYKQIRKLEDDLDASRLRYKKNEVEEQELADHNLSFQQTMEQLLAGESEEEVFWRLQDALEESNNDYKKAQMCIEDLKDTELERQRSLNNKIEDCHIKLRKERRV